MGLGSTAKKVQTIVDTVEDLYSKLNDVRSQLAELRETVEETSDRIDSLEHRSAEQQVLLEALAENDGIDVDELLADVSSPAEQGTTEDEQTVESDD